MKTIRLVVAVLVVLLVPAAALAQTPQDKAASVVLFNEGRALMEQGKVAEACARFEAASALAPGAGIHLNLGDCYERLGRTASAWGEFRSATLIADRIGDQAKGKLARARMKAIEPRLSRLTLTLPAGPPVAGLEVRRDGAVVPRPVLGTEVTLDPGEHVVEASAPGHKTWSAHLQVQPAERKTVPIPPLVADEVLPPLVTVAPVRDRGGRTRRLIAYGVGGAGVVAIGVGTVFGLRAKSKWDDARDGHCRDDGGCDLAGVELTRSARKAGDISTVAFLIGGAAIAGGVVLYLTAPADAAPERTTRLELGPLHVALSGTF